MLQGLGIELIAAGANRRRLNNWKIDEHDALWRSALRLPVGPASPVFSKSGHAAQTREGRGVMFQQGEITAIAFSIIATREVAEAARC